MSYHTLRYEAAGNILTLNRPDNLDAFTALELSLSFYRDLPGCRERLVWIAHRIRR